ncbi:MAG: riboflavin kinase [Candidatus Paceibacterota bacterium]
MLKKSHCYQSTVQRGDQTGRRFIYPTINLNPSVLSKSLKRGVYASRVTIADQTYFGALYFGPRVVKKEKHDVLEIYLLDFTSELELYGQPVEFSLEKFIRGVVDFPHLNDLREQISKDILAVKEALNEK